MKRILIGFLKIIVYLAFVVGAVYYTPRILAKTLNTPYPLATITSSSMWPALKVNDLILMKGAKGSEVEIGQIIIYKNQNGFTIHRLIRKDKPSTALGTGVKLVTKGDANNIEDQPIEEKDVIGRAVYFRGKPFRIPKLGFIARSLGPKILEFQK